MFLTAALISDFSDEGVSLFTFLSSFGLVLLIAFMLFLESGQIYLNFHYRKFLKICPINFNFFFCRFIRNFYFYHDNNVFQLQRRFRQSTNTSVSSSWQCCTTSRTSASHCSVLLQSWLLRISEV